MIRSAVLGPKRQTKRNRAVPGRVIGGAPCCSEHGTRSPSNREQEQGFFDAWSGSVFVRVDVSAPHFSAEPPRRDEDGNIDADRPEPYDFLALLPPWSSPAYEWQVNHGDYRCDVHYTEERWPTSGRTHRTVRSLALAWERWHESRWDGSLWDQETADEMAGVHLGQRILERRARARTRTYEGPRVRRRTGT